MLADVNANRITSGAVPDDLLNLTQDRRLIPVPPHQLPEVLFGEVGSDV